jgi:putative transposase
MDYDTKNHSKSLMLYHLIFVWKYRKNFLLRCGGAVKQIFIQIATTADFSFEAMEVDRDHLHCLVKSEPKISPLSIIRKLKQQSTFRPWQKHETDRHRGNLERTNPWSDGYFVVRLAMPVRRPFAATLPVKGEMRRFIHEAEDLVDEAPDLYKK